MDRGVGAGGSADGAAAGGPGDPLLPGDPRHLDGYAVLARLGEGGQGTVYLARDPGGALVALKVLLPEVVADRAARDRIAAEVALARRVPSFCTARLLGARLDGDRPYLVTEYVAGPSLARAVLRSGPLSRSAWERLMVGTLTALVTIHRAGVVHHDLKPENILLGPDGPRVVDFGIALRTGARDPQANADGVLGSAAFLAPERLDAGPATPASDMFGWAATMVHAATGASPFRADTRTGAIRAVERSPARLDGVPPALRPLLAACLAKEPARRPVAADALDALLEALQPAATAGDLARAVPADAPGPSTVRTAAPPWGTPAPAARRATARAAGSTPVPALVRRPVAPTGPWAAPGDRRRLGRRPRRDPWLGWLVVPLGVVFVLGVVSSNQSAQRSDESSAAESSAAADPAAVDWSDTVAFGADGVEVIDAGSGSVVRYRQLGSGEEGASPNVPDASTVGFRGDSASDRHLERLSADARRVAAVSIPDGESEPVTAAVHVYDAATGRLVGGPWSIRGGGEPAVATSRDGSLVVAALGGSGAAGSGAGHVTAWRGSDTPVFDADVPGYAGDLAVSPDGAWIAVRIGRDASSGAAGPHVRLRHVPDGRATDLPADCTGPVAFDPAGTRVYCQHGGTIQVLGTDGSSAATLPGTAVNPGLLAVSPDGTRLAQSDVTMGQVRVHATRDGALLAVAELGAGFGAPTALAFAPDSGRWVVVGRDRVRTATIPS